MKKALSIIFTKYINGTRGVISLFLAILMLPFVMVAGALINAGRVNSAIAVFDEALCNASNSALGTYDQFLRERFGLMAISQDTSTGGSGYGGTYANYTAGDLLNDTFKYYMEQNLGVLPNTYSATKLSATGLYPLADTSVLFASVLQAGKYTVPARMAMDWTSLDDIVAQLGSGMSVFSSIGGLVSSGADTVTAVDKLIDKKDDYKDAIGDSTTAKSDYDSAYGRYVSAIESYNRLIDEINQAQAKVNAYAAEVKELEATSSGKHEEITELENKIKDWENDAEENGVNHDEEIEEAKKKIEELEENLSDADKSCLTAKKNLESAQQTLESKRGQLAAKRETVSAKKTDYYNKIIALRDAIEKERNAAIDFKNSIDEAESAGEELLTSTVSTVATVKNENSEKQQKALKEENKQLLARQQEAQESGYTREASELYNQRQENISAINNLKNDAVTTANTEEIINTAAEAQGKDSSKLNSFAARDIKKEYTTIYDGLTETAANVDAVAVPTTESQITGATGDKYHYSYSAPATKEGIEALIKECEASATDNPSFKVVKAVVSFLKALFEVKLVYDGELNASIDTGKYADHGGLPSGIDRSERPLVSAYDKEDKEKSDYYKQLLSNYTAGDPYSDSGDMANIFDQIVNHITGIANCLSSFTLDKIKPLVGHMSSLISLICNSQLNDIIQSALAGIGKKVLLTGYISYNTANRTTYDGKALTGARYKLPSDNTGYCFCGAETEYIFAGNTKETANQIAVFNTILLTRLLFDAVPVFTDSTVQALSNALCAVPYVGPILKVLLYVVYLVVEAFLDVVILVNGEDLPIYRSYVFLTPGGIPKLMEKISSFTANNAFKQKIFDGGNACMSKIDSNYEPDARFMTESSTVSGGGSYTSGGSKLTEIFNIDYTKTLQLLLLLTKSTDTMVKRLADIIQMESSYKAHYDPKYSAYDFNLDYSYTYIRASGNFTSGMFMNMSDWSDFSSSERVIYTGY